MTEQKIEMIVMVKLGETLTQAGLSDIGVVGTWQQATGTKIKAHEDGTENGVLALSVKPRQYETPTIPDCAMEVALSLVVRSDTDSKGQLFLSACDTITGKLQTWQKSFSVYAGDFSIEGEFIPTGFRLSGGDVGLDADAGIWQFTQSFEILGITNN